VTDGYFDLMQIRLVSGRLFGAGDRFTEPQINQTASAERGIIVVTEQTARTLWPGQPAVGQALWLPDIDNVRWREVVGVVEDIQFYAVGEAPALHVFIPWTQDSAAGRPYVVVKTTGEPAAMTKSVREIALEVDAGTEIDRVASLDALVGRATAQPRFTSRLVAAFGALALLLAGVGIYGTLSYLVGTRTRDIGIRVALGASRATVLWDVLRRGVTPAVLGGALGVAGAVALARTFRALLFEVGPVDALSVAGGVLVLLVVALVAAAGPARRATQIDPVAALRTD
jgi:putative ABC transport system permease protein